MNTVTLARNDAYIQLEQPRIRPHNAPTRQVFIRANVYPRQPVKGLLLDLDALRSSEESHLGRAPDALRFGILTANISQGARTKDLPNHTETLARAVLASERGCSPGWKS